MENKRNIQDVYENLDTVKKELSEARKTLKALLANENSYTSILEEIRELKEKQFLLKNEILEKNPELGRKLEINKEKDREFKEILEIMLINALRKGEKIILNDSLGGEIFPKISVSFSKKRQMELF
jgi:hypothetical protein